LENLSEKLERMTSGDKEHPGPLPSLG
jgi:hypothetical protein